jgi:hypothetical protein
VSIALDMQRGRAASLAGELVQRSPPGSIACIFAGGSLGRGEVWAAELDGVLEVYSDIDLYVVAARDEALPELRRVAQNLPALAAPDGVRFLRPPDIGVYTPSDLAAQPKRPGTAELDTHHLLLHGNEAVARSLHGCSANQIPWEEALYLLENRAMELSAPAPTEAGAQLRLSLAQSLKARLDVYSAHAIVSRSFAVNMADRAQHFAQQTPPTLTGAARDDVARAFAALPVLDAWLRDHDAEDERWRALTALADAWLELGPKVLDAAGTPAELVARRCRAGDRMANAREVIRIRHVANVSPWRAMRGALRLAHYAPIASLRVDPLARVFATEAGREQEFNDHFEYVDRLTQYFAFTGGGTREERVRRMYKALS